MVNSVLGPIDSSNLGLTLVHEHVASVNPSMSQSFPNWFNPQETISRAVNELLYAKQRGLQTIVDATPINLGRDVKLLREVAEKSNVNIIAATGFYHVDEPFLIGWEIENLVDLLLSEIEEGIQGTDIKPGVIKCASETQITETNEKLLRTVARLHGLSGLPVITHSSSRHKTGLAQQAILLEEEVNPKKLVIGHCGDTTDIDYIESLLMSGSYIGLDRFGLDLVLSMEKRIDVCVELCEKGYENQVVLSQDYNVFIDWWPADVLPKFRASNSNWSYHHILVDVIPRLLERGVSQKQIDTMVIQNLRKILD